MVHPGYRKRTIVLLLAVLLVRFWYCQTFDLSGQAKAIISGYSNTLLPNLWDAQANQAAVSAPAVAP